MSVYLALELADDRKLGAVAAEWDITDGVLDGLEATLPSAPDDTAASAALVLGRAGRPSSAATLAALGRRMRGPNLRAVALAQDLLRLEPPGRLERAEAGYRWTDPKDGEVVFVEDHLAAHWHELGRWGPPIRPWLEAPILSVDRDADVERSLAQAREGRRLRVCFAREGLRRPPDLYLTRAGFGLDPKCAAHTRWSSVTSIGFLEGRRRRMAWAGADERPRALPSSPLCGPAQFEALFRGLRSAA
ncbi:MAG: hypothetical protein AAGD10_18110 [Myxococcota bacterium]